VVQVDPIKPTLKAPGSKRLKLEHENLLSNFGFKFNLRRYSVAPVMVFTNPSTGEIRTVTCSQRSLASGGGFHSSTFQLNLGHF